MSLKILGTPRRLYVLGSEITYWEIYTGERYLLPMQFKDGSSPIDITAWNFALQTYYYTADYSADEPAIGTQSTLTNLETQIDNLNRLSPQPNKPADLVLQVLNPAMGQAQITIPSDLTPPSYVFPTTENPVLLCIINLVVTKQDTNRQLEPFGFIIRGF